MSDDTLDIAMAGEMRGLIPVFDMMGPEFEERMRKQGVHRIEVELTNHFWCSCIEDGKMVLHLNPVLMEVLLLSPSYAAALRAFLLVTAERGDERLRNDLLCFLRYPVQLLPLSKREKEIVHKIPVQLHKVIRTVAGIVCEETGLTFREGVDFVMRFSELTLDDVHREIALDEVILKTGPDTFGICVLGLVRLLTRALLNVGLPIHDNLDLTFFEMHTRYTIVPPVPCTFQPIDIETGLPAGETYDTLRLWIHNILNAELVMKEEE